MTLSGCTPAAAPSPESTLEVTFAGCERVSRGPLCLLKDGAPLSVWVRDRAAESFAIRGLVETLETTRVQGGTLHRLQVLEPQGTLAIHVEGSSQPSWTLRWARRPLRPEAMTLAKELEESGELERARSLAQRALPGLPPGERGPALRFLARLEGVLGDAESSVDLFRRAIETLEEEGWLRQSASCAAELVYRLIYDGERFADARSVLAALEVTSDHPAEAHYNLAYMRGLLALNTGDARGSLTFLRRSVDIAERGGLVGWREGALQTLAEQLQRVGRRAEAAEILSGLLQGSMERLSPCDRATLLNNLAWNQLLVREAARHADELGDLDSSSRGEGELEDPTPWLLEARTLFADRPCHEYDERASVEINLALAALHANEPERARRHLEASAQLEQSSDRRSRFWRLEIEARLALALREPREALRLYGELEALADQTLDAQTLFKAASGRARALEAMGRPDEALAAYAAAESYLSTASLGIPIDAGRESFVDLGSKVVRDSLELLLSLDRVEEAYALARRARTRVLRSLHRQSRLSGLSQEEQRHWDAAIGDYRRERRSFDSLPPEDWRLPADELQIRLQRRQAERARLQAALDAAFATLDSLSPALDPSLPSLPPGELRLLFYSLGRGWIGFAESEAGLAARELGPLSKSASQAQLSSALLGPFTEEIERSKRLKVLPVSWLRGVDLHALPFAGKGPLVESRPVVYGLDLPHSTAETAGAPGGGVALVVADPSRDLAAARREGDLVLEQLRQRSSSWRVRQLLGPDATSEALRRLLPGVELFHYAGHGIFDPEDGWQSFLPLADSSLLTVGDILALERAPRLVVLSGCETGRATQKARVETASGLAHAFVTAGSQGVIAAARPVDDAMASQLVRLYYRHWLSGLPPGEALRRAQVTLREGDPSSDWASFRLIEP